MSALPADLPQPGVPIPDPAMFHGILGRICAAAEPYTEADPVGILVSLLAGCGVLIGPDTYVDVGSSRHRVLIWPILFGTSGTGRKGEATNTAMLFLNHAFPSLRDKTVSGLSSGEGLIEAIRDPDEEPAKAGKDPVQVGTEDKRLLCIESEFSSVLARAAREGNTLNSILRAAWDGGDLMILNRQRVRASGSHIGIVAHVTPKEFVAKMAKADMAGGTFNRFLPVWVDRARRLPVPERVPLTSLTSLTSHLVRQIDLARRQTSITLSPEADALWRDELYDLLTPDVDDREDLASEFTRRSQPYCRRLAALYALLDLPTPSYPLEPFRSERYGIVGVEHLRAAYALVRYSMDSAAYVLAGTSKDRAMDRLTRAISISREGLDREDIRDLFSKHKTGAEVDVLMARLDLDDRYEVVKVQGQGRPRTVVRNATKATEATEVHRARDGARYATKAPHLTLAPNDDEWAARLADEPEPEENR